MILHGHFEKGRWVPGPMDNLVLALAAMGASMAPAFKQFSNAVRACWNVEVQGRFVQGRWVSVTLKDILGHLEDT